MDRDLVEAELELEAPDVITNPCPTDTHTEIETSPPLAKKAKGLSSILSKLPKAQVTIEASTSERFKREVNCYLDQPCLDVDSD